MYRYYILKNYFAKKLTILFLYQKGFINSNIVNKIKYMYLFNYKIVTDNENNS